MRKMLIGSALAIALAGHSAVASTVTLTCRCVEGGVNSAEVTWLKTFVFPSFEKKMADEGRDITVRLVEFGGGDEGLKEQYALDLSVGSGADIMSFDGFWVPEFVEGELLKPLNQVVGASVDEWEGWAHIPEGIQAVLSFQGERYGVPGGTDVRQIFYRTDVFERAGIPAPWQPTSWQEIIDTGMKLRDAGIEIPIQLNAGTSMGEATTMQGYFMALLGAGEHMYDFEQNKWIASSSGILDTLNFYHTIYVKENLGAARVQLVSDGRNQSFEAFRDGKVGMLVEGDWFWRSPMRREMGEEKRNEFVSFAKMPAREPGAGFRGQDFVTISGGTGWLINPNSENPQDAWELLAFMSSAEAVRAKELIQPRISFRDDVSVAGDPVMTAMADALLSLSTVRPLLPAYPKISVEAQLMTERVVSGEFTPEEAMAAYAEAVIEIVGEDNAIIGQ
ncbi:MAG: extracellular solute-binding protein [Alphaproteobacteria bacterium]